MRLFVGVELPPDVGSQIDPAVEKLRARLRGSCPKLDARWVESDKLHITLWFLGETADGRVPAVTADLALPFRSAAFPRRLGGFGAFPSSGPARVIWIGIPQGGIELRSLNAEITERVVPLGFEPEQRPFAAHLTVARVRDPQTTRGRAVRQALDAESLAIPAFTVTSVTLFRSRLSPKGSQYEAVLRVPLS